MAGVGVIPIVRKEDFASPALTDTIQQLLSQVQGRLVGVLRKDDMPIPACCIRHAAHQSWLKFCTYALNGHTHMSLPSTTWCLSGYKICHFMHLLLAVLVHLHCQLDAVLFVALLQIRAAPKSGKTCNSKWELCVGYDCKEFARKCCKDASLCLSLASRFWQQQLP